MKRSKLKMGIAVVLLNLLTFTVLFACTPQQMVGKYVNTEKADSWIELVSVNMDDYTGIVNINFVTAAQYKINNVTAENLNVELYNQKGTTFRFKTIVNGYAVGGSINVSSYTIYLDGAVYKK